MVIGESSDDKNEIKELLEYMKTQSQQITINGAFLVYKDIIMQSNFARDKCAQCGYLAIDKAVVYCPSCGFHKAQSA